MFEEYDNAIKNLAESELSDFSELLIRSYEKAMRVALIFAVLENVKEVSADIARRATRLIDYSNSVAIGVYQEGVLLGLERIKLKALELFDKNSKADICRA